MATRPAATAPADFSVVIIDDDEWETSSNNPDGNEPEAKRCRYEHVAIRHQHKERVHAAVTATQGSLLILEQLRSCLEDVARVLFPSGNPVSAHITPQVVETALQLSQPVMPLLTRIRRHHRHVSTLTVQASQVLEDMKQRRRYLIQKFIDYQAQLTSLRYQTRAELSASQMPKFASVIPQLCPKEEFESSDVAVLEGMTPEDYYLSWLKFDLSSREAELAKIDEIRGIRQAEEEKLKLLKKRETELAAKIAPIEKDLLKLLNSVSGSSQGGTPISVPFPARAYSLPAPLFRLFTQLFAYKIVNGDPSVDARLSFQSGSGTGGGNTQPTSSASSSSSPSPAAFSLFTPSPGRVQVVVDKGNARLPPTTYLRAAPLFPLTVRFTFFPHLNLVSAMCQFPKVIGTDVTFLADLCFPDDDGTSSPNPLHHIVTTLSQLIPDGETTTDDTVMVVPNPSDAATVAKYIATQISELQFGRVYRWAQILAGLVHPISDETIPSVAKSPAAPIDAKAFVTAFRERVSLRAWTLHIEESLKHQPQTIPPLGITLPVSLGAAAASCADMMESFVSITSRAFRAAGGCPSGVMATVDRDVRFLKGHFTCNHVPFAVLMALPLDARNAELCIQVRARPSPAQCQEADLNPKTFSILDPDNDANKDEGSLVKHAMAQFLPSQQVLIEQALAPSTGGSTTALTADAESMKHELLRSMLPASKFGWEEISVPGSLITLKKPSHFCDPGLAAIQEAVNVMLPASYGGRTGTYGTTMPVLQLVSLTSRLLKWTRRTKDEKH